MEFSQSHVLEQATKDYLETLDPSNPPVPVKITENILTAMADKCREVNTVKDKGETKWKIPIELPPYQIALILSALYSICKLACAGESTNEDYDLLAVYQTDGANKGIYVTDEASFRRLARKYNANLSTQDFKEMLIALKDISPRKEICRDRDLVAVNNGIFNYKTKELQPFNPEIIFTSKSHVDYNPNAVNVVIHNDDDNTDWDVESWMHSLSDDDEIVSLFWEILSAIIRPNVRWSKAIWLYSERGNNGKGSLCELMRSLIGVGSYASIPISDMGKDFMLEPLTNVSAIIVDENDVGVLIDKCANLKAIITNDVIQINRKFKQPIAYRFYGLMVQCLNEFPRIKDKSDSFYRRQLFIPMTKCFTGRERKYIKENYLHNKDVLEYVLYKVLNTDFYTFSEPEACKEVLKEYKEYTDTIRLFWNEFQDKFVWDLLPNQFLYDLYIAFFPTVNPNGKPETRNIFLKSLRDIINADKNSNWEAPKTPVLRKNLMDAYEPLIMEYNLCNFKTKDFNYFTNINFNPARDKQYRGIKRKIP